MREQPTVISEDKDISASAVEFRRGVLNQGDWYVTWVTRSRPWEVSCMRLSLSDMSGKAWHHGRQVAYRVCWQSHSNQVPAWQGAIAV